MKLMISMILGLGATDISTANAMDEAIKNIICNYELSFARGEVLYFGVWDELGHFYYDPYGNKPQYNHLPKRLQRLEDIDGGFCRQGQQCEGLARLHFVDGWTILSFWDRSGDSRRNSHSTLVVKGNLKFEEMKLILEHVFPKVWRRIKFPIVLEGEDR